jgi:hypothetical protein
MKSVYYSKPYGLPPDFEYNKRVTHPCSEGENVLWKLLSLFFSFYFL